MKITKRIPSRTVTFELLWLKKDFIMMDQKYRAIREKIRKKMEKCFWCNHQFEDGEMMALVAIKGIGNRLLCKGCAGKIEGEQSAD